MLLPTYDVFDESRYFQPAESQFTFTLGRDACTTRRHRPAQPSEGGNATREWMIAVFQNTMITSIAVPKLADVLAEAHRYKGDSRRSDS